MSEDAAPIKVALALSRAPEQKEEKKSAPAPTPRAALALGDDDDDGLVQKKKRALVKLEYEAGLDAAQKKARETAQLIEISKRLPSSKGSVFRADVNWAVLEKVSRWNPLDADSQPRTRSKILGLVERNITSALGELDQDLVDFVMGHLEGHKGPEELVDELSPVSLLEAFCNFN